MIINKNKNIWSKEFYNKISIYATQYLTSPAPTIINFGFCSVILAGYCTWKTGLIFIYLRNKLPTYHVAECNTEK